MFKRILGKTGIEASVVGFGGIIVMNETPGTSAKFVAEAVNERGITYFDVAPSYGNAEERLGPALAPYRNDVALACKTGERKAEGAEAELNASLKRMQTDHFDVYQLHAMKTMEDVETVFGPGGAMELFVKAREQGKVRFLGFSAHSEEAALALMDRFDFDTILFPINWACWLKSGFGPDTIAKAKEKSMGILALKTLAKRAWDEGEEHDWSKTWYKPVESYEEAKLAVRFTLSQGASVAVSPGHMELFRWECDAANEFQTLTDVEEATLRAWSADLKTIFPQG
ncbi:MAG: aldo/keto reductase [Anaerolineae bacterium]|nr:aldo/keto reductase [Anaerolineae bacterium]